MLTRSTCPRRKWALPFALLALLAVAALAYAGSLHGEFQFDDAHSVKQNLRIRDLGSFLQGHFLGGYLGGRPVTELTFAIDHRLAGLQVFAYHATNVLLHLAAVVLVFLFTRRTLRRLGWPGEDGLALWIAGVFALHPLQTQAVSYICQRAEVLASVFYLLALLLLFEAEERGRSIRGVASYGAALAAFLLGLGAKPIVVTLPAIHLLHGFYFPLHRTDGASRGRRWAARIALSGPFLVLSCVFTVVQLLSLRGADDAGFDIPSLGPWRYFLTELRVLLRYLSLLLWPAGQNLDYVFPVSEGLLELRTLAAGLAVATLAAGAVLLSRGSRRGGCSSPAMKGARLASFGAVWFFVVLAPTSSFVPIADVIEEHRVYLASWGVFAALSMAGVLLFRRVAGAGPRARRLGVALGLCAWAALGVTAHARDRIWRSKLSLWKDVVAKSPEKSRAHHNLGHALHLAGDDEGAVVEYRAALHHAGDLTVEWPDVARNLGASLLALGRRDEALGVLEKALGFIPYHRNSSPRPVVT